MITSLTGRNAVETLEACVPNLRGKILIDGAGHWIQQERPTEVNQALLQFLATAYQA